MRQRLLPACLAGLLLLAPVESAFAAVPAPTIEDRALATRAVLDALFSMEALVAEGAAPTPPPGFSPDDADEAALIAFLARQKRRGASLDAYRQLGTPLHHAIRVGLHDTACWLLANGADPRLRVRDAAEAPTGFPPPDALGVAVAAGAWKLVDTLLRQPTYAALSPREKARVIWPYALASAGRTAGLFDRRAALPSFDNDPELSGAVLRHALCSGQAALAGALLAGDGGRVAAGSFSPSADGCQRIEASVPPDRLPPRQWHDIEQRLGQPVLPWLAIQAATPARAARLLAAGLRSPWGEPAALGLYVRHALRAPAGVALLRAVPPGALRAALHDDAILAEWLTTSVDWPRADLDWALAQVAPARLAGQLPQLLERWGYSRLAGRDAGDHADRLARWTALTDRLAAPLPPAGDAPFLYVVPSELWPRWFALGYRPTDRQWADWFAALEPANLERVWPLIARHQPEIARRAPTWLVAPLSVGPIDDPEARRLSYRGLYHHDPDFLAKARFLAARAGQVGQARWLAAEFAVDKPAPGVALALAQGWVKPAPAALSRQVELAPPACKPRPGPGLRRALAVSGQLNSGTWRNARGWPEASRARPARWRWPTLPIATGWPARWPSSTRWPALTVRRLFPHRLDEAARGLAAAPGLSLPERRRRMAWLQARRSPRPAYSDDTVASLVPWLPAEDWAPLVEALRCSRPATLDAALARARELQRTDLERRLQRPRAQGCEAPQ